jgi:hypothetical protein
MLVRGFSTIVTIEKRNALLQRAPDPAWDTTLPTPGHPPTGPMDGTQILPASAPLLVPPVAPLLASSPLIVSTTCQCAKWRYPSCHLQ